MAQIAQISYFCHCIQHPCKLCVSVSFSKRLFLAKLPLFIKESADTNQGVRKIFSKSTFQIDKDVKRKQKSDNSSLRPWKCKHITSFVFSTHNNSSLSVFIHRDLYYDLSDVNFSEKIEKCCSTKNQCCTITRIGK